MGQFAKKCLTIPLTATTQLVLIPLWVERVRGAASSQPVFGGELQFISRPGIEFCFLPFEEHVTQQENDFSKQPSVSAVNDLDSHWVLGL